VSFLCNYFDGPTKLFSDLYLAKFSNISAKSSSRVQYAVIKSHVTKYFCFKLYIYLCYQYRKYTYKTWTIKRFIFSWILLMPDNITRYYPVGNVTQYSQLWTLNCTECSLHWELKFASFIYMPSQRDLSMMIVPMSDSVAYPRRTGKQVPQQRTPTDDSAFTWRCAMNAKCA